MQPDFGAIRDLRIHPHPRGTRLQWDVVKPPPRAKYGKGKPWEAYFASATYSSARKMMDDPRINHWMQSWGPLTVHGKCGSPVTVQDVLEAIYAYFHSNLTWQDFYCMTVGGRAQTYAGYCHRIVRDPTTPRHYLRVDALQSCTRFVSLNVLSCQSTRLTLSLQLESSRLSL